jgi:hypothetical protein
VCGDITATDYQSGRYCRIGLPVEGKWEIIDDYFHQLSSGGVVNDVIHAKAVDGYGRSYSVSPAELDGYPGYFQQTVITQRNSPTGYFVHDGHTTIERREQRFPDYKGKRKVKPRTYIWYERVAHPYLITLTVHEINRHMGCYIDVTYPNPTGYSDNNRKLEILVNKLGSVFYDSKAGYYRQTDPELQDYPFNLASVVSVVAEFDKRPPGSRSYREMYAAVDRAIDHGALTTMALTVAQNSKTGHRSDRLRRVKNIVYPSAKEANRYFLFDEPYVVGQGLDPMLLGRDTDFSGYWRNWLMQHALLDVCENFPKLSDNSIQNISGAISFLYGLVAHRQIEIPHTWQDAWLSYRYSYGTTRMDVKDAVKFVRRMSNLGTLDRRITCHGSASTNYRETDVTCRCTADIVANDVGAIGRLLSHLERYGLTPDFYVLWDSIPYSFMVDWFIPIGDMVGVFDTNRTFFTGSRYTFENISFSLKYTRDIEELSSKLSFYTRWKGSVPSNLNELYWFDAPSASVRTVGCRILDTASLFIGR